MMKIKLWSVLFLGIACVSLLPAQSLSSNLVVINYEGAFSISEQQFAKDLRVAQLRSGRKLTGEERQQLLDGLIGRTLVHHVATKSGIRVTDTEVTNQLRSMWQNPTITLDQMREQYLVSPLAELQGWDDFLQAFRQQMVMTRYFQAKISTTPPSRAEVEKVFNENREIYRVPTLVRVSHIFFAINDPNNASLVRETNARAQDVLRQINANTITFEQAVRMHTNDSQSASRLGDLGEMHDAPQFRAAVGDDFVNRALAMRPGQISPVITGPSGLHIVRVTDRTEARQLNLNDPLPDNPSRRVSDFIAEEMELMQFQQKVMEHIEELRGRATITVNQGNWSRWADGTKDA